MNSQLVGAVGRLRHAAAGLEKLGDLPVANFRVRHVAARDQLPQHDAKRPLQRRRRQRRRRRRMHASKQQQCVTNVVLFIVACCLYQTQLAAAKTTVKLAPA